MMLTSLLLAVTIAIPQEGARLPFVPRVYLNGAAEPGVTNLVIQGQNVPVHPSGGWVTMIEVKPGLNTVQVGDATRSFYVAEKTPPRQPSRVIVLDPGHGGTALGTISPHGWPEKEVNLALALKTRTALEAHGFTVVMTREDDAELSLPARVEVGKRAKADAFVSIHHNAPGLSTDPRKVRYHTVYAWNEIGRSLAKAVNRAMAEALEGELKSNGVMINDFVVTRNTEIPSCLIETDFITTPEGEQASWDPERQTKIASSIALGLAKWHKIWYNTDSK